MTIKINTSVIDNGLSSISTTEVKMAICQTEPTSVAEVASLSGAGGKRITDIATATVGQITLSDGANSSSRKLVFPSKALTNGSLVAVALGSADLWIAVYTDSSLLLVSDGLNPIEVVVGQTIIIPSFEFGIAQ